MGWEAAHQWRQHWNLMIYTHIWRNRLPTRPCLFLRERLNYFSRTRHILSWIIQQMKLIMKQVRGSTVGILHCKNRYCSIANMPLSQLGSNSKWTYCILNVLKCNVVFALFANPCFLFILRVYAPPVNSDRPFLLFFHRQKFEPFANALPHQRFWVFWVSRRRLKLGPHTVSCPTKLRWTILFCFFKTLNALLKICIHNTFPTQQYKTVQSLL